MNIQFYQILSNWWPLKECFVINSKFISTYLFIIIYSSITFFSIYLLLFLDESFSHLLLELLFLLPNNTMNLKKILIIWMGNCGIEVFSTYVGGIVGITSSAISMRKSSKKLVGLLLKCNILLQTLTSAVFFLYFKYP